MPDPMPAADRTAAQRQADHASLARLAETLVPALVAKLTGTGLGELEVREGDWQIRVRRPAGLAAAPTTRRSDRPRLGGHPEARSHKPLPAAVEEPDPHRAVATSPAVGTFRPGPAVGTIVRAGDRIGAVDMLGIPQDVPAPIDGTLVELLVQAGEAVEYGEEIGVVEAPPAAPAPDDPADAGAGPAQGSPPAGADGAAASSTDGVA